MADAKEYIVILRDQVDLDNFYDDMESKYTNGHVPSRQVELAYRRPTSRSTHYYLTDDEVTKLSNDPRVESITLTYQDRGLSIKPMLIQTSSNWSKSSTNSSNQLNWGLLRGYESSTRPNWGSDGTADVSGSINLTNIGNNVDVVISDGHLVPGHPEWAKKLDGTGGSRLVQYNWFTHNQAVRGTSAGTYVYDFLVYANGDNNHGNNVAGIACGSSCGWARGANIYNISPYSSHSNYYGNYIYDHINYIREWHASKPINVKTGRRNPTIVNMSWGLSGSVPLQAIDRVNYQGTIYNRPPGGWTTYDRIYFGLVVGGSSMLWYARDSSLDADLADAINDGIILVGAAGNFFMYNDSPSGINYNNYLDAYGSYNYYMRGPSPGSASGVIQVSAINATVSEKKADYSNAGGRTDIFSPGSNIMGAYYSGGVADPRSSSFKKAKLSGTSMASPQVTGVLACAMETYPNMSPAEAKTYIQTTSFKNQLAGDIVFDTSYGTFSYLYFDSLYGANNYYLRYNPERPVTGVAKPKTFYKLRGTDGCTYPRTILRRYG